MAKLESTKKNFKKKECMLCGNKNTEEIETTTLYSDDEGNDDNYQVWICKEDKGCSIE